MIQPLTRENLTVTSNLQVLYPGRAFKRVIFYYLYPVVPQVAVKKIQ